MGYYSILNRRETARLCGENQRTVFPPPISGLPGPFANTKKAAPQVMTVSRYEAVFREKWTFPIGCEVCPDPWCSVLTSMALVEI